MEINLLSCLWKLLGYDFISFASFSELGSMNVLNWALLL